MARYTRRRRSSYRRASRVRGRRVLRGRPGRGGWRM